MRIVLYLCSAIVESNYGTSVFLFTKAKVALSSNYYFGSYSILTNLSVNIVNLALLESSICRGSDYELYGYNSLFITYCVPCNYPIHKIIRNKKRKKKRNSLIL